MGDVLIDGQNRYAICKQHDIAFRTVQNDSFTPIVQFDLVNGKRGYSSKTVDGVAFYRALFDAAREPKELLWYDAGHHLPPDASAAVAAAGSASMSRPRASWLR